MDARQQVRRTDFIERCAGFLRWFCRLIVILLGKRKGGDPCVYIPERIINRPDPCIYDQFLLMQLGLPVTWDNPDVAIFLDGVEQNTYDLRVSTEYDVEVTVHNSSREKPANGTLVDVRWIEFGAGGQIRHAIATLTANIPIWPGVATVAMKWMTPPTPGHFCIEVELSHAEDGNPSNNRGWNNTQVKTAESEVQTPIRVFNRWPEQCPPVREGGDAVSWWRVLLGYALFGILIMPILGTIMRPEITRWQQLILLVTGYFIGAAIGLLIESLRASVGRRRTANQQPRDRISCHYVEITVDSYRFNDGVGKNVDPHLMFADRPPGWPARIEPAIFVFTPSEAYRDVILIVDAPDGPGLAEEVFNVNVRQGGVPAGGVTVTITRTQET